MKPMRIHEESRTAILPYDKDVEAAMPDRVTKIEKHGNVYLLVPARVDELKVLKNCGYEPPAMYDYTWGGMVPFDSQKVTAQMLAQNSRAYVLNEMGTGKTLASLFAYDYLRSHGIVRRMLVVAPLSTITTVWEREVFSRLPHLTTQVLWNPSRKRRLEYLNVDADIFVINHDGLATLRKELIARPDIDIVLVDELAVFRNAKTNRWKYLDAICKRRKYVWGMTGSPTPRQPTDAWAQIKLLTPHNTTKYFSHFRDATMVKQDEFRWDARPDANDIVFAQMRPSVRFQRQDCLDLPPHTVSTRRVEMSGVQKSLYKEMKKNYLTEYHGGTITAANAGVKTSKLLQIACGFGYDEEHNPIRIPSEKRLAELIEIVEETEHKLIVFTPFIEAVDILTDQLRGAKIDAEKIYGNTKKKDRDNLFADFQHSTRIKVLVCHPQTTAHGLTLTAASTIVWYGPHPSLEIYEQANARITRPGQRNNTHVIHLESSDIERHIYNTLMHRADAQTSLLKMFEEETK